MKIRRFNENIDHDKDFTDVLVRLESIGDAEMPNIGYDNTIKIGDPDFEYCYADSDFKSLMYGEEPRIYKGVYFRCYYEGDNKFKEDFNDQPYSLFLSSVENYNHYALFLTQIRDVILIYEKDYFFTDFTIEEGVVTFSMFPKTKEI